MSREGFERSANTTIFTLLNTLFLNPPLTALRQP